MESSQFYLQNTCTNVLVRNKCVTGCKKKSLQCPQSLHGPSKTALVTKQQSFGHWYQTTISDTNKEKKCLFRRKPPVLQVLAASAVRIPVVTTVFHVARMSWSLLECSLGLCSLVPMWLCMTHEASAGGAAASLAPSPRISLTCSRLSAWRINSSFTWRGRGRSLIGRVKILLGLLKKVWTDSSFCKNKNTFDHFRLCCIHMESGRRQTKCHLSGWEQDCKICWGWQRIQQR